MIESGHSSFLSIAAPPLPQRLDLHTSRGANANGMVVIARVTVPRVAVDPGKLLLNPLL